MRTRIYIVEDHPIMQKVLREFIEELDTMELGGMSATAEEALEHLCMGQIDLVLVDISLPKMSGDELISVLHDRCPELPCLVLSGHGEAAYVQRALDAGARGYILKGDPYEIEDAIQQVLNGSMYLSESLRDAARNHKSPSR